MFRRNQRFIVAVMADLLLYFLSYDSLHVLSNLSMWDSQNKTHDNGLLSLSTEPDVE
jgi:hypothetical protein